MSEANKKPQPLYAQAARAVCPVCGMTSYSPSGVHPQCAMAASDEVLTLKIKATQAVTQKTAAAELRPFEKRCPRCKTVQHVRKRVCECGYAAPILKAD